MSTKISKFLSYVLRHRPDEVGIILDEQGWVEVEVLLKACKGHIELDLPTLERIVAESDKKRFAFSEDGTKIRASQGHSVDVDLGYQVMKPPDILFHGSALQNLQSILARGISRGSRHHVHLSVDKDSAAKVGRRHGKPVVFLIDAKHMHDDGCQFFLSANGVWLTYYVDPKYVLSAETEPQSQK